jgi:hypothetical protein
MREQRNAPAGERFAQRRELSQPVNSEFHSRYIASEHAAVLQPPAGRAGVAA